MKITTSMLVTAASIGLFAAPAMAQSDSNEWQGGYIGGSIGANMQGSDSGETVLFDTNRDGAFGDTVFFAAPTPTTPMGDAFTPGFCNGAANGRTPSEGCRDDKDKIAFAVRAGYDWQNGNIVYGVVAEAGTSNSRDSVSAFSTTPAFYTLTRELDYTVSARVRAGYVAGPALLYATGGVAYARIDNSFTTSNAANSFADNGKTGSFGYSFGGGAEAKVAQNVSVGLEYLYTNFTKDSYRVNVGRGTAAATNPFLLVSGGTDFRRSDRNFDSHGVKLNLNYRF
jgi:outer membrane immunogenic protein